MIELITWWLETLRPTSAPRTIAVYREAVTRLMKGRETLPDRRELERYFSEFRETPNARTGKPLSSSYVNQHWRSLQQFYKFLEAEGLVEENPFNELRKPKIPDTPVPIFSDAELSRLFLVTLGTSPEARRDRVILRLLLDTGMRVGELIKVKVSDVDFEQRTILVTGKGSHSRRVPFGSKAYSELRRWLLVREGYSDETDALLVNLRGKKGPISYLGVRAVLNRRAEEADVPDMRAHRFRHTAAHLWLKNGGSEVDLRRIMGWRSESMVYRYAASTGVDRALSSHRKMGVADQF